MKDLVVKVKDGPSLQPRRGRTEARLDSKGSLKGKTHPCGGGMEPETGKGCVTFPSPLPGLASREVWVDLKG